MINKMPQTGTPEISVVITSYNYGVFLPRAIESVIGQDIPDMEIVIVDNCSTDDSWAIIERYAARDPRIRPFRNEHNLGLVGNHMRGLEHAHGRRVLFLSADDYLLPGHLNRALSVHREHPDIDVVVTTYYQVDEHERIIRHLGHIGHLRGDYYGGRNEFAALLTYDCYTCLPTTLLDREYLISSGGFDRDLLACDLDIYLRFAAAGKQFAFIESPGACIRVHSGAASGVDRYVATGKQLLEHLVLLERYLQPEYEALIRGHENGIARLLQAKINNLLAHPAAQEILPREKARIDALVSRINQLFVQTASQPPVSHPLVSVIFTATDDLNASYDVIAMVERQTYKNVELVAVIETDVDATPMLMDRIHTRAKYVTHRRVKRRAASLNDARSLVGGDIVVYADASVAWPHTHLERVVAALADPRVDAVTVPLDFVVTREGADVARYPSFTGGSLAQDGGRIGESIPLASLAHRRRLYDAVGTGFEENIDFGIDVEFVQRILSRGPIGVVDTEPLTWRVPYDTLHPGLADPNIYMGTLRAIYQGRPVDPQTAARREAHFNRLSDELRAMGASPDTTRAHLFWSVARGATPHRGSHRERKRVLVIDDCVPYNELGRGYPRARTIIEDLRDAGYDVFFYPLVRPYDDEHLRYGIPGVTILYGQGPELLGLTLDAMLDELDVLWVSRPHNMRDVQSILRAIRRTPPPIVYDAEAVYVERDRIKALLEGLPVNEERYGEALAKELAYSDECAVVTAVSAAERELIATRFKGPIEIISFSIEADPTPAALDARDGLLFVGAIESESPNDDALYWLATQVAPLIPAIPLRHAGVMNAERIRATNVQLLGVVPDLRPIYNASRIFVAPTRFAAGLPQKVYEAAANGLPVIASTLIATQLGWANGVDLLVADTPQEWVDAITRLSTDSQLWQRLREGALTRVRNEVSPEAFRQSVLRAAQIALKGHPAHIHA